MGVLALLYGVVVYLLFFAAFLYLIPFVAGNMLGFLGAPKTLDWGNTTGGISALIDVGLLLLFGLQHSVMARRSFKKVWTKVVPMSVERTTYVLATTLMLYLLYDQWRPLPSVVWDVGSGGWRIALTALFFLGHRDRLHRDVSDQPLRALRPDAGLVPLPRQAPPEPVFRTPHVL